MKDTTYQDLSAQEKLALDEAAKILDQAYNPYSHFYVGACLYDDTGQLVSGANVENASYGLTICAERSAIVRANAMGLRNFTGIAIIARGENFDTKEITGPCGNCRQMLYELSQVSGNDLKVILATTKKDKIMTGNISELLPYAFGPLDINIDIKPYQK